MWHLIRKDTILGWRTLAINGATALLFPPLLLLLEEPPPLEMFVGYVTLMCAMLPVGIIAKEDKFAATALTCSLPVTRRSIVTARYWGAWLIGAASIAVVLVLGLVVPDVRALWGEGGRGAVLTAFVLLGLVIAAFVPFTIRFGLAGVLAGLVALQVLGLLLFMTALLTGGIATIEDTVRAMANAVADYRDQVGLLLFTATLIAVIAAVNWASWLLAQRIFRARDL